jgi:hypothetical protein
MLAVGVAQSAEWISNALHLSQPECALASNDPHRFALAFSAPSFVFGNCPPTKWGRAIAELPRSCLNAGIPSSKFLWCLMITPDQFRERLRRPKKPPIDWAKWIGSPTAWLALTISASSLYLTLVRKSDDLRVVVSHRKPMSLWLSNPDSQIELREPDQTLMYKFGK